MIPVKRLKKNNSVTEPRDHNTIKNLKEEADNLKTKTNKKNTL